jgi:predicted dehydrogenase
MALPYTFTANAQQAGKPKAKNDRFRIGAIGMHNRGTYITRAAADFGDVVAIADVDRQVAEKAKADFGGKADLFEDYCLTL